MRFLFKNILSDKLMFSKQLVDLFIIVGLAIIARVLCIHFFPIKAISADFIHWERVTYVLFCNENPYIKTTFLNHPPFWMQILYIILKISLAMHTQVIQGIRAFLIMIESGIIIILYFMLKRFFSIQNIRPILLVGISLNPICILLVCQHGNFDVLVGFWVLCFIMMLMFFIQSGNHTRWLYACFFLGLGILTKTVPIILLPLLFFHFRKLHLSEKILGTILVFGPTLLGLSIIYVLNPESIISNVFMYRSLPFWYGISGLLHITGLGHLNVLFGRLFIFFIVLILSLSSYGLYKASKLDNKQIVMISALFLALIPTFGPGYSTQYIYWFLPLFLILSTQYAKKWRILLYLSYSIAIATYLEVYALSYAHGAFLKQFLKTNEITNLSNLMTTPSVQTILHLPLFICYIAVIASGLVLLKNDPQRRIQRERSRKQKNKQEQVTEASPKSNQ